MWFIHQFRDVGDLPNWAGPLWRTDYAAQPNFADAYFPTGKAIASHGNVGDDHGGGANFGADPRGIYQ